MCCFFIHFHPVVPDMEKAGLNSNVIKLRILT